MSKHFETSKIRKTKNGETMKNLKLYYIIYF